MRDILSQDSQPKLIVVQSVLCLNEGKRICLLDKHGWRTLTLPATASLLQWGADGVFVAFNALHFLRSTGTKITIKRYKFPGQSSVIETSGAWR